MENLGASGDPQDKGWARVSAVGTEEEASEDPGGHGLPVIPAAEKQDL